ncbi:MAG: ABC transporter permease, partial [Pseudomonadota bacterium]
MADATADGSLGSAAQAADGKPGPVLAADGTPLKRSLARALRMQKIRALMLVAPLLLFVLVTFIAPIADMLFRSVENQIVQETLPETVPVLASWEAASGEAPGEDVFLAMYVDLVIAEEYKIHTRLGSRLNYEEAGISSLFRGTGRKVGRFDTDVYTDQFLDLDEAWESGATWERLFGEADVRAALPFTARSWDRWAAFLVSDDEVPAEEDAEDFLFTALYSELVAGADRGLDPMLDAALDAVGGFETVSVKDQFLDADEDWADIELWQVIQTYSPAYTSGY